MGFIHWIDEKIKRVSLKFESNEDKFVTWEIILKQLKKESRELHISVYTVIELSEVLNAHFNNFYRAVKRNEPIVYQKKELEQIRLLCQNILDQSAYAKIKYYNISGFKVKFEDLTIILNLMRTPITNIDKSYKYYNDYIESLLKAHGRL